MNPKEKFWSMWSLIPIFQIVSLHLLTNLHLWPNQPTTSVAQSEREREVLPDQQKGSPFSCFWIVPTETLPAENLTKCYKVCTPQTWETSKLSKKPAIDGAQFPVSRLTVKRGNISSILSRAWCSVS
jgi:hypothetical protein